MPTISELRAQGRTWAAVARELGYTTEQSARRAAKKEPWSNQYLDPTTNVIVPMLAGSEVIRETLRPINVELAPAVKVVDADVYRVVLWGDTHFPFQDNASLDIVEQVAQILRPTHLIHMGDMFDFYHLSRFDKNPDRVHTLQDELDLGRAHIARFRYNFPNAQFWYLEGNHEDRLKRMLWKLEGPAAALTKLTKFRKLMTMDGLLGLTEMGVNFVPYDKQGKTEILPKMVLKHGSVVRKWSGRSAQGEWEKVGRSGASGHIHRLGAFWHRKHGGGAHTWVETGCTCTLDPEFEVDPDWQQGLVVLTIEKETGAVSPEPVYIREGRAMFRGNFLHARV